MSAPRTRSSLAAALIAALLFAQMLGLVHRIVHAPAGATAAHVTAGVPGVKSTPAWVDTLFAGHDKGSACALYDQLLQPHAAVDTTCSASPAFAPPRPAEQHRAWLLALQAHGFLARGPPASA